MELLESINKEGRPFLVYIDAEFQTYRVPSQRDPLESMKYTKTPYDFGMSEGNFGNNKYHFLLNIGFIIIGPYGRSSHFAMFPSHFSSGVFENPQLLEPGYTTCSPYTDYQITEKKSTQKSLQTLGLTLNEGKNPNIDLGLTIVEVANKSEAYDKGIMVGDVVLSANQNNVNSVDYFRELVKDSYQKNKKVFLFLKRGENNFAGR